MSTIIANYISQGGINQYYKSIMKMDTSKNLEFKQNPKVSHLLQEQRKGKKIIFCHLTKEVIAFIIRGGSCYIIWHDPKLRVGFTLREFILYHAIRMLRYKIKGLIVHSQPDPKIEKEFRYLQLPMPLLDKFFSNNRTGKTNNKNYQTLRRPETIEILFFGRVVEYKGLHKYVGAFEECPNLHLTIAGGVSLKLRVYFLNNKKITLNDRYIEDQQVPQLFSSADYVIMPYKDVTNTHIHTLAFDFGKPVIRTDIEGFSDWENVCADLIFSEGKKHELKEILKRLPHPNSCKYQEYISEMQDYMIKERKRTSKFWLEVQNFISTSIK